MANYASLCNSKDWLCAVLEEALGRKSGRSEAGGSKAEREAKQKVTRLGMQVTQPRPWVAAASFGSVAGFFARAVAGGNLDFSGFQLGFDHHGDSPVEMGCCVVR